MFLRARFTRGILTIEPLAHFLAGLEKRHALLVDRDVFSRARIAARARRTMFDRERPKTTQFDPIAPRKRGDNLVENRVHDVLHIPLIEVRVVLGDALNEFGFDHRDWDPYRGGSISVKMVRTVKSLNAIRTVQENRRKILHRGICGLLTSKNARTRPIRASIRGRWLPQCQHSVETQPIRRPHHAGLLHLTRNAVQSQRIEGHKGGGTQERQVAEARR